MLVETNSVYQYVSFINELSQDSNFSDPHFSYDQNNLYKASQKKNQKIYVSSQEGMVDGIFVWLVIPEEHYAELIVGLSRSEEAWTTMIEYIEANNPEVQMDFVYNPGNTVLGGILQSKNATFEKPQKRLRLMRDVTSSSECKSVELDSKFENQYISLHEKDTYWTAEKVLAAKDRFRVIAAIDNGELVGYMDVTSCFKENEPYALFTKKGYEKYRKDMLAKAIQLNRPNGMMVQVDVDDAAEITLFEEMGFETIRGSESVYATFQRSTL